ncbi:hypothetical protein THS27_20225 [Thalassospira sp. MCCC 1A01428]|nr:hypothetical protein THS27_20225 [Thalassospira sp. MCCC 1A01428]
MDVGMVKHQGYWCRFGVVGGRWLRAPGFGPKSFGSQGFQNQCELAVLFPSVVPVAVQVPDGRKMIR